MAAVAAGAQDVAVADPPAATRAPAASGAISAVEQSVRRTFNAVLLGRRVSASDGERRRPLFLTVLTAGAASTATLSSAPHLNRPATVACMAGWGDDPKLD